MLWRERTEWPTQHDRIRGVESRPLSVMPKSVRILPVWEWMLNKEL